MSHGRNPILVKIYAVVGILIVIVCTLFTLQLIYNLWFPPFFDEKPAYKQAQVAEMEALAKGIQPEGFTVAYRTPEQNSSKDRFHNIPVPRIIDDVSLCITCHGILPHNKNIETRAFINKHSANIACETCHISGTGKPQFKWYNVNSGALVDSIKITGPLMESQYKIIIAYGLERFSVYDRTEDKKMATILLKNATELTATQRKSDIKPFHNGLKKREEVTCTMCHNPSGESYLPLASLGYPQGRINQLMNSEVVGMVLKYKDFYLPAFMGTGAGGGGVKP